MKTDRPRSDAPAPLTVALAATKPLPASNREECHDLLERQRVTVEQHQAFCEAIAPPPVFDEIDVAAADPILDHIPQAAPARKVRGLLEILDQLNKEKSNRRFAP